MTLRPHKRQRLADNVLRAHCEIAKRVLGGLSLDDATLTAISYRFEVDATSLAVGMLLRHAFGPHRMPSEMN